MVDEKQNAALAKSLEALIEETLVDILAALATGESSPHTRELRARALTYERAIQRWPISPPSNAQRQALLELIAELHAKVMTTP